MRSALIVGAGIGGLAAGLALRRAGWDVRIHERASTPRELGFALVLAPNAVAALRELNLADAMLAAGVEAVRIEIRTPDGRVLRALSAQIGGPSIVALRPVLHGALLQAVGADALTLGSQAASFTSDPSGVTLLLQDGGTNRADVLVGADGVHSIVRRQLHSHEPPPTPSGFSAVRGVAFGVSERLGPLTGIAYLGDGVEAAVVRASANAVYWYLSLLSRRLTSRDAATIVDQQLRPFEPLLRSIVAATTPEDMRFDELFERHPLPHWGERSVTLLGDAAHPVLPHTGQGAAQALEDAVALGLSLSRSGSVEANLRDYERVRSQRTRHFIQMGPRIARMTTTTNPVIKMVRTAAVRWTPEAILARTAPLNGRDPHRELRESAAGKDDPGIRPS